MNEITISRHAQVRLSQRYDIKLNREYNLIRFLLSLDKFEVIKKDAERANWVISIFVSSITIKLVYSPFTKTIITALSKGEK